MEWTKEQEKVIDVRDRNVLVSAAAGSGKTAVLVERIMQMIMDKNNPIDIDKLLVVTFTKAAAGEMRERILKKFEKALDTISDDDKEMKVHLEKQCTYIHNAHISTIDGFCTDVIREYISLTDIDPGYRVADNSEIVLMKEDALSAVLDRWYEEMSPEFMNFVDTYSAKVGDDNIERLIERLHNYAQSYPNPRKWIIECGEEYDISNIEEWKDSNVAEYIKDVIEESVLMLKPDIEYALELCTEENCLVGYRKALIDDLEFLSKLETDDVCELLDIVREHSYARFGKTTNANEAIKSEVTKIRADYKKCFDDIKDRYAKVPLNVIISNINACKESVEVLIKLALDFDEEFKRIKKEKNVLDFSDIEHYALNILTKEENGQYYQTDAAKELSKDFVEIMIDEYQDSNHVQEVLLRAVSKCNEGKNNIFMVGDVKQSIYKFRQARPELFLEKYYSYPDDYSSDEIKIVLSKNFRSRKEVIDSANLVFSQIMSKELGGVIYDEQSKLNIGAKYDNEDQDQKTELILIDDSKKKIGQYGEISLLQTNNGVELSELEKLEAEAVIVANRINKLINESFMVKDKATEKMRPIQYKDIVILFRSKAGTMDKYMEVLTSKGIPASSVLKESALDTFEINVILNFLRVIDNPRQDIPFVSMLKHIFGYNENHLADIRKNDKYIGFYESFVAYEGELKEKNENVLKILEKYRHYATYMPIHRLIKKVIDETRFIDFVSSMQNGEQRLYNIDVFIEKAEGFAKGTYTGLFNFIRYIEKLKTYQADSNDDVNFSEDENTVKLMTIHKSKGLEFPVVFVAAMGKGFNTNDSKAKVVMHNSLGIGIDRVDLNKRIKYKTVVKEMILSHIKDENLAEEIRILYVALTRAKEKLILVGTGNISDRLTNLMSLIKKRELSYPKEAMLYASSLLDLIIMSLVRHKSLDKIRNRMFIDSVAPDNVHNLPGEMNVTLLDIEQIVYGEVKENVTNIKKKEALLNWDVNKVYSNDIRAIINERFSYVYEYENDTKIKAKHSVSDIKHAKMEIDEFAENKMHTSQDEEEYVPNFMRDDNAMNEVANEGALRGSAVHRFFELFDYELETYELSDIEAMMECISNRQLMSSQELKLVIPKIFVKFMKTELGKRMKDAYNQKLLFRERPFVMGMRAKDVDENYDSDELVVVQGIIDAFFYENDEIVIVDYKTDDVKTKEELVGRYKAQLDCYADAIRKVTGKNVKEKLIYSTKFGETISV